MRAGKAVVVSRGVAAEMLGGIHVGTVNKWVREGSLERVFLGRRSMITVASIENLIRRARVAAATRGKAALPDNLARAGNRSGKRARKSKTPELSPAL
jgi:hypothetical protein